MAGCFNGQLCNSFAALPSPFFHLSILLMSDDSYAQTVASAFEKLNAGDEAQASAASSRTFWAAVATIAAVAAVLAALGMYVIGADRRAEEIRLQQAAGLAAQSLESHILSTTEVVQKLSMRFLPPTRLESQIASADFMAATIMKERREILEVALVDKSATVIANWRSSETPSHELFIKGERITAGHFQKALDLVYEKDSSAISGLYTRPDTDRVYASLITPSPAADQMIVVRLDLSRLLTAAIARSQAGGADYRFSFVEDGQPLVPNSPSTEATEEDHGVAAALRKLFGSGRMHCTVPLRFLGIPVSSGAALEASSYAHALFTTNRVQFLAGAGLAALLLLSLGFLMHSLRQQQRAHRLLATEYALRRAMAESSVAGIRVTDTNGKILYVNETFQKIVGYRADELVGLKPPYPYWTADFTERVLAEPPLDPGTPRPPVEFEARHRNGDRFFAELRTSKLYDSRGRELGYIGALYDVTPEFQAKQRLEEANERFTRVMESMNSAIAVVSAANRTKLAFANRTYRERFGEDAAGAARLLDAAAKLPQTPHRSEIYDQETGRWWDAKSQKITWTKGEPAILVAASDVTARREFEIAREEQKRRAESTQRLVTMGEMASSLAHELNQPLAAIANYAGGALSRLEAHTLTDDQSQMVFSKIESLAERAGRIIVRIRGFAKKTGAVIEAVSAETVVSDTFELALIMAKKFRARVEADIEPNLPMIKGDSVMLEQLLLNLIKNALEAAAESPVRDVLVKVAAETLPPPAPNGESRPVIRFSVIDHGPGIPDAAKAQLFDAFYSTKSEGMGMGLNICRTIAELHGGRITISDTPGGGSTFSFTAPVFSPEALEQFLAAKREAAAAEEAARSSRINGMS